MWNRIDMDNQWVWGWDRGCGLLLTVYKMEYFSTPHSGQELPPVRKLMLIWRLYVTLRILPLGCL